MKLKLFLTISTITFLSFTMFIPDLPIHIVGASLLYALASIFFVVR